MYLPELLTDKSLLQEIYDLRVSAYEASPKSAYVNRHIFPNGWIDHLDEDINTLHWVVKNEGKIIASARLTLLQTIEQTKEEIEELKILKESPFAFYCRLVVHPQFWRQGIGTMLDKVIVDYVDNSPDIKYCICLSMRDRHNALIKLGFTQLHDLTFDWSFGKKKVLSEQGVYYRKANSRIQSST